MPSVRKDTIHPFSGSDRGIDMDKFTSKSYFTQISDTVTVNKVLEYVFCIVYAVVWFALLIWYWKGGNASVDGYKMISFTIVLPVMTVAVSFFYGISKNLGIYQWIMVLFFAVMYLILDYFTFELTTMLSTRHFVIPDWHKLMLPALYSLGAMFLGFVIRVAMDYHRKKEREALND